MCFKKSFIKIEKLFTLNEQKFLTSRKTNIVERSIFYNLIYGLMGRCVEFI